MATLQHYEKYPYFPPTPPHNFPSPPKVPPSSPPEVAPPHPPVVPSPPHIVPSPPHPISPAPPHVVPSPPHPISPPPPHVVPSPPSPHPISPPPPPPPHIVPHPPHPVFPPPPHIVPSPPHPFYPPPPPPTPGHHTIIIIIFVSLGGLFFLAFLAIALFCFLKKRKKRIIQETDRVKIDEHTRVHEDIIPGPHGAKAVILTIDEDVDIEEEIKKNEVVGSSSHMKSAENHP